MNQTLAIRLQAIDAGLARGIDAAGRKIDQLVTKADKMAAKGDAMTRTGHDLIFGISGAATIVGKEMLDSAGGFERSMRVVKAVTSGTSVEMDRLASRAVAMGQQTQYTAQEAAGGMSVLARAGLDVSEIYTALPGVLQLAAAGEMSLADAAGVATDVLGQFQLGAANLADTNDVLAKTANASKADLSDLAVSLRYVGPVANGMNMSLRDTSAALAVLSDNGLRASLAGTALRGILTHLTSPSKQAQGIMEKYGITIHDSQNKMLPFIDILKQFETSGISAGEVMKIFGQRAGPGMISMIQSGSSELSRYNEMLKHTAGSAQSLADAKMGGFLGAIKQLKGSLDALAINVGNSGVLSFFTGITSGARDAVNATSELPKPILAVGAALLTIAAGSGPLLYFGGKMAKMYKPVVEGAQAMIDSIQLAHYRFGLMVRSGIGAGQALATVFGPQAAVVLGLAALAGVIYLVHRNSEQMKKSHEDAGSAAVALATAAGLATRELKNLDDAQKGVIVSEDDFRKANENAILTLRNLHGAAQQGFLVQIGYEMILRGAKPEDALDQVRRLAAAAGVEVPVDLKVSDLDNFKGQIKAAASQAKSIMDEYARANPEGTKKGGGGQVDDSTKLNLDRIAKSAADAFNTQGPAAFVAVLGSAVKELKNYEGAQNYLNDQSLKFIDIQGLSLRGFTSLKDALTQLSGPASSATEEQKKLFKSILATASTMKGGLTDANIAAAASTVLGSAAASDYADAAKEAGDRAKEAADGTSELGGAADTATEQIDSFKSSLKEAGSAAAFLSINAEAAAKGQKSYLDSIANSTTIDDKARASLKLGDLMAGVREGFYGVADGADQSADSTDAARKAIDGMGNALSRTDSKFSLASIRFGSLAAAADAYKGSIDQSTNMDNQIKDALSLGDAYKEFRHSVKRLPEDFDTVAASMGKYKPLQEDALQDLMKLGSATTDYISTLIQSGASYDFVRSEAARLRDEYAGQMKQAGLTEGAVSKYLQVLGLTPEQVETAIKVSGEEAARFKIETYLSLLEGRIPPEVATKVTAEIESGNLDGAASTLASWAKSNPVEVNLEVGKGKDGKKLWDLPKQFDPLTAAMGGYTKEQREAVSNLQDMADQANEFIAILVGEGKIDQARSALQSIRDQFTDILKQQGLNTDEINNYLGLLGLTDQQFETSVIVSGTDEAMFKIQAYVDLLGGTIPPDVATEVLALIDEGSLTEAANRLETWRTENSKELSIPITPNLQAWANLEQMLTSGLGMPSVVDGGNIKPNAPKAAPAKDPNEALYNKPQLTLHEGRQIGLVGPAKPGAKYDAVDNRGTTWGLHIGNPSYWINVAGRAWGGKVEADTPYRVLEQGRSEIFVPETPGKIVPINKMRPMDPGVGGAAKLHKVLAQIASNHGGLSFGDVKVVSPSAEEVPEKLIATVGDAYWLKTGRSI